MPAALKNPSASSASPRTKSPFSSQARRPEKEVMAIESGIFSALSRAFSMTCASPSPVVLTSSLSVISSAVGPARRFPCTVGVIRMPLPSRVGCWKMVWDTKLPAFLSIRIYSPLRGGDMQLMGADFVVELIRVYTCRIHHTAGGKGAPAGTDQISAVCPGNVGNRGLKTVIHAVHI